MLVLSRKQGQQIFVGSSVVVTIVRVSGDKVRIGIEAPDEMRVLRGELQPHDYLAVALSGASVGVMPSGIGIHSSVEGR